MGLKNRIRLGLTVKDTLPIYLIRDFELHKVLTVAVRMVAYASAAVQCRDSNSPPELSKWIAFEVGQMHLSLLLSLQIQFLPSD